MYSTDLVFFLLSSAAGLLWFYYAASRAHADPDRRGVVVFWRDIFIIFFAVFVFRGFFYDWFKIPSNSMQPTLRIGDYVLVEKNHYGYRFPVLHWRLSAGEPPKRGQIVVFRKPGDEVYFIKRIIALPGDKISYLNGVFYIDDRRIDSRSANIMHFYSGETMEGGGGFRRSGMLFREYLPDVPGWHGILLDANRRAEVSSAPDDRCKLTNLLNGGRILDCEVPPEHYFVAGDNRDHSNDSRYWGLLPATHLIGPAVRVLYNFSHSERAGLSLAPRKEATGKTETKTVDGNDGDDDDNNGDADDDNNDNDNGDGDDAQN